MGKYERVWTVVAAAICAAGFTATIQGWPRVVVVLAVSLTGSILGGMMALPWLLESSSWTLPHLRVMVIGFAASWVLVGLSQLVAEEIGQLTRRLLLAGRGGVGD